MDSPKIKRILWTTMKKEDASKLIPLEIWIPQTPTLLPFQFAKFHDRDVWRLRDLPDKEFKSYKAMMKYATEHFKEIQNEIRRRENKGSAMGKGRLRIALPMDKQGKEEGSLLAQRHVRGKSNGKLKIRGQVKKADRRHQRLVLRGTKAHR